MHRLKTRHSYHDAEILAVEFGADDTLVFCTELCSCSGSRGRVVHLSFYAVKNASEVRQFLTLLEQASERVCIAQIIDFDRDDDGASWWPLIEDRSTSRRGDSPKPEM